MSITLESNPGVYTLDVRGSQNIVQNLADVVSLIAYKIATFITSILLFWVPSNNHIDRQTSIINNFFTGDTDKVLAFKKLLDAEKEESSQAARSAINEAWYFVIRRITYDDNNSLQEALQSMTSLDQVRQFIDDWIENKPELNIRFAEDTLQTYPTTTKVLHILNRLFQSREQIKGDTHQALGLQRKFLTVIESAIHQLPAEMQRDLMPIQKATATYVHLNFDGTREMADRLKGLGRASF